MWKNVNGRMIQLTDPTRIKFRTNISKTILENLKELADQHDTHINYLLENGIQNVLQQDYISFNKKLRPKDRVQYKTTYDQELLNQLKTFAKKNDVFINDVIEYSVAYIEYDAIKNSSYKHRVE